MTKPLTPDEVTDLISSGVASWSPRRLDAIDRLELSLATIVQDTRLLAESCASAMQAVTAFVGAYQRAHR